MARRRLTLAARIALGLGALICVVAMVGPFQGAEQALVPWDKAAHFIAFYGATLLMFAAFPGRRRFDLAMIAVLGGCAIELAQQATGRDAGIGDVAANALGALAVWAPIWLERTLFPLRAERRRRRAVAAAAAAQAVRG